MHEKTIPDLIDELTKRAREVLQLQQEAAKKALELASVCDALEAVERDHRGVNLDVVHAFVEQRGSELAGEQDDINEELESIKSDFEEYVDQFRRERESLNDDFEESKEELTTLLQGSEI